MLPGIRVAIVTGAAQGIGRATALRLAADGLQIAAADLPCQLGKLTAVVKYIQELGGEAIPVIADISQEQDVKAMVYQTVSRLGKLDVMVANAGLGSEAASIIDANIEKWDRIWKTNIRGTALCFKYAASQMVEQGDGGRIIAACSIAGKKGMELLGGYSSSKFAIRGLTQTAALDLRKFGITVNAYAPGVINTPLTTDSNDAALGGPCAAVKKAFKVSDAKVGQPEDVASAVSYLASPEAHFITGQTINIDGGFVFD